MKKRGKRFERRPLIDPVRYVLTGFRPLPSQTAAHRAVLIQLHSALVALQQGKATDVELRELFYVYQLTEKLVNCGYGTEHTAVLSAAAEALKAIHERPRYVARGPELTAMLALAELHEAQLNLVTVNVIETARRELETLEKR